MADSLSIRTRPGLTGYSDASADIDLSVYSPLTQNVNWLDFRAATELTIDADGAITPTQSLHRVDTLSDAATDNLDTITAGTDGAFLRLWHETATHVVTIRHDQDNIVTPDGEDMEIPANGFVDLQYDGEDEVWRVQGSGAGGGSWGDIEGTLSDQTDLQAALDTKPTIDHWVVASTTSYTATPSNSYRITMSDTTGIVHGLGARYRYNSTYYYGIVSYVSDNSFVNVTGAPLSTGADLQELAFCSNAFVVSVDFCVAGTWADDTDDSLLENDMSTRFIWPFYENGYLVLFGATQESVDSGTEGYLNVSLNGSAVCYDNTWKGVQLGSAGWWVWTNASGGYTDALSSTYYDIGYHQPVELEATAGGTGDAEDLTVQCVFVLA